MNIIQVIMLWLSRLFFGKPKAILPNQVPKVTAKDIISAKAVDADEAQRRDAFLSKSEQNTGDCFDYMKNRFPIATQTASENIYSLINSYGLLPVGKDDLVSLNNLLISLMTEIQSEIDRRG